MPWSREEDFKRNNALSLYDLYGTPLHKKPCPGAMKFTFLVDPSLVIITIDMNGTCPGVEKIGLRNT